VDIKINPAGEVPVDSDQGRPLAVADPDNGAVCRMLANILGEVWRGGNGQAVTERTVDLVSDTGDHSAKRGKFLSSIIGTEGSR
jgi:hypothetical protein